MLITIPALLQDSTDSEKYSPFRAVALIVGTIKEVGLRIQVTSTQGPCSGRRKYTWQKQMKVLVVFVAMQ